MAGPPRPVADLLPAGTVLAQAYRILSHLGSGGMADTYLALDVRAGTEVAVKLLRAEHAGNRKLAQRFWAEAELTARLRHPNIVGVLGWGKSENGVPYLAMELVHGRTLGKLMAAESPLTLARIGDLMAQLLGALDAAHQAGVVHADVKSGNILVETRADGGDALKLLDFGLAEVPCGVAMGEGRATVSGTPEYLAPEVIRGSAPGVAADLYGAGAVLYELLTSSPPFCGRTPREVIARQLYDQVVPPSLRSPERAIPPALDAVVLRALAKDPARRPGSAAELAASLRPLLCDAPGAVSGLARGTGIAHRPAGVAFSTRNWRAGPAPALPRHPPRRASVAECLLRGRIDEAMGRGDGEEVTALYVDLTTLLARQGQTRVALAELEHAMRTLCPEDAGPAAKPPEAVWRLFALAARLHDAAGRHDEARGYAGRALFCLERAGVSLPSEHEARLERLAGRVTPLP
jgi:protein kinase-like protein